MRTRQALVLFLAFVLGLAVAGVPDLPATARVVLIVVAALGILGERLVSSRASAREREGYLVAALEGRLRVLDLLGDRGSVAFEDFLDVVLAAVSEVAVAPAGTIAFYEGEGEELAVAQQRELMPGLLKTAPKTRVIPLKVDGRKIGEITLAGKVPSAAADAVLDRLAPVVAQALVRARRRSEEKASAAYLEAANLVKSRFLTTISHELRTPLTSVIGYAKTLDNHWNRLPEEQKREFVREVETQGNKLNRLLERVLEAARVELQGVEIKPEVHDVRHSVQRSLAPFMATDAHRVRMALPERPIEAEIDPFVIDQVVSNLVDNALRYTKGGVRVSLDAYRSSVTIAISDEGPGIDPAQLNLVLEPLYRIDENVQSGTGLGLHIVRTLVEAHGGRGEIRSGANGTSIAVKLPRTTGGRLSLKVPPSAGMRRTG